MTLTEAARFTKILLLSSLVILVILVSGWISYQVWYTNYYLPTKRAANNPAEVKFGILPKLNFPPSPVSSANFSYSVDTETGELPKNLPHLVKVYFVPQLGTTLLSASKAQDLATKLKFSNGPEQIDSVTYRFRDDNQGSMVININSDNFTFNRQVATNSASTNTDTLPSSELLVSNFKNSLNDLGLLKDELKQGRTQVDYDNFVQKNSTSANISIWPSDINEFKIVTPTFTHGVIQATVTKNTDPVIRYSFMQYSYWPVDIQNSSTYPIKTADQSLIDLKSGRGVIIIEPKTAKVSITSVYLAYFEPLDYPQYLQPIFVFQGDSFAAYVPAVTDQYREK